MSIMPFPDVAGGLAISPACYGLPDPYTAPAPSLGAPTASCGANQFASNSGGDCQGAMPSGSDGIAAASVIPMSLTSQYASGCTPTQDSGAQPVPPVLGIAPVPAPGSGAPFSQPVNVVIGNIVGNPQVAGMLVNCIDTGVTLATTCANVTFFHNTGGVKSYTMFAMAGTLCPGSTLETAHNAVNAHGTVPNVVSISANFS